MPTPPQLVKGSVASYAIHAEGLTDAGPLRDILVKLGAAIDAVHDIFIWDLDGKGDAQNWDELYPLLIANRIRKRPSLVILRQADGLPLPQDFIITSSQDIGSTIFQCPFAQQAGGYRLVMANDTIVTTFCPIGSGIRGAMQFGEVGRVAFSSNPTNGIPSFLCDRGAHIYNTQGMVRPIFEVPAGPAPGSGNLLVIYGFDSTFGFQGENCVNVGDNSDLILSAFSVGLDLSNPVFDTDCIVGGRTATLYCESPGVISDPTVTLGAFLGTIYNVPASLWGGSGATAWRPQNPFNQPTLDPVDNTIYVNTQTFAVEAMIGGTWTTIANLSAGGDFVFGASSLNDLNATLKEMPPGFSLQTFADGTNTGAYMTAARTFTRLTAGVRLGNAGNAGTTLDVGFYVNGVLRQSVTLPADQATPQVQSATFAAESVVQGDLVTCKLLPSAGLAAGVFTLSATLS